MFARTLVLGVVKGLVSAEFVLCYGCESRRRSRNTFVGRNRRANFISAKLLLCNQLPILPSSLRRWIIDNQKKTEWLDLTWCSLLFQSLCSMLVIRIKILIGQKFTHKIKSQGWLSHTNICTNTSKKAHVHTNNAMIMIYMGPVWAKMQSWPVRSLSLWTIQMSGSVEIENMETLLARAKTSLPTKPRDIKNEVSGWMASGISRFPPQEKKKIC